MLELTILASSDMRYVCFGVEGMKAYKEYHNVHLRKDERLIDQGHRVIDGVLCETNCFHSSRIIAHYIGFAIC